ncbi:MAG: D-alanyl-D-alanine carboxypeptidase/D-alanyl-D-alanine endopeptidase [Pyrinomonadaceae bacterium]
MSMNKLNASLRHFLLLTLLLNATGLTVLGQAARGTGPAASPTPAPTPQASPTPQAAPTPARPAPQTVKELRERIQEVLDSPPLAPALVGIKVASLDTGRVLFEENAGKLLIPASNMKLYTVAAALDRLGPDFRFVTSVYAAARPDEKGRVRGDLIVYGRGDPTYSTRFNGGDYFKAIDELAAKIAAAGVKEIEGDLVGDESYFTGPPLGYGWEWDDLQWYYGAPISALTVNDNAIDLFVKPGAKEGAPAVVTTGPMFAGFPLIFNGPDMPLTASFFSDGLSLLNTVVTGARGSKRQLEIHRPPGLPWVYIKGSVPADDTGFSGSVSVPYPATLFTAMLRASLHRQGVTIKNSKVRVVTVARPSPQSGGRREPPFDVKLKAATPSPLNTSSLVEIARRESPPFAEIAAQTSKPSQNLYTELILRTLGKQFPKPDADPKQAATDAGTEVVRTFLREAGVDTSRLSLVDGSGLARSNLITAEATLQLLTYMSRHRHAQIFRDAQPVAGVDGTLRNRLKGTPAAGNVRAKTGTLNNVSALSGYVTTAAGERLVFSLIVNHYSDNGSEPPRTNFLDQIAALLASFAGRS